MKSPQLLIVLDGQTFGGHPRSPVSIPTILDNLTAEGQIPPTLAILINEENYDQRERDLNASDTFAAFLAHELIPWAETLWNTKFTAPRTTLFGTSAGGLGAAYSALKYPNFFGNVISFSGHFAYEPSEAAANADPNHPGETWLTRQYRSARPLPVRFYLEVGQFERHRAGLDFVAANRQFRDLLKSRGYDVTYRERPGGHHLIWWRGSIADALISLARKDDRTRTDE